MEQLAGGWVVALGLGGGLLVLLYGCKRGLWLYAKRFVVERRSFWAESIMSDPYYRDWSIGHWGHYATGRTATEVLVEVCSELHKEVSSGGRWESVRVHNPEAAAAFAHHNPASGSRLRVYGDLAAPHGLIVNDTVLFWHNILRPPVNMLDTEDA